MISERNLVMLFEFFGRTIDYVYVRYSRVMKLIHASNPRKDLPEFIL